MSYIKVISLSKKKFKELEKISLSKEILNTEGIIYEFNYRGKNKILKTLYNSSGATFANKLYTIEMLDVYKEYLPTNFYIPDYLCNVDQHVVGFTVPKIDGINLNTILTMKKGDYKEQIYYLKKIGEILVQLHNIRKYTPLKDFYIGDLHESNFMVDSNNRELKVIDLDSSKIGFNKASVARFLTDKSVIYNINKYIKNTDESSNSYIIPDSNTDMYCYIIMILNYLYGINVSNMSIEELFEYLNYLEYIGVNKELINVFSKIVSNCKNESPLYYLDSLTPEQIYRSSNKVYNNVKGKKIK